jgi:hypothetical protein
MPVKIFKIKKRHGVQEKSKNLDNSFFLKLKKSYKSLKLIKNNLFGRFLNIFLKK